ncbi:MAG: aminoacetone oxidase family FAD-binding enzyme [Lachnospiraceae bacterium]
MKNYKKIAIIGGGASGLMAASAAIESGAFVTLFERGDSLGKKLLITGNGRGNFTNLWMDEQCFRSNTIESVASYLEKFSLKDTLSFFDTRGLRYKDKNGYLYPYSGQASALVQFFVNILEQSPNCLIMLESKVSSLTYLESGQVEVVSKKKSYLFDKVIVAAGSQAAPKTGSDGTGYYLLEKLGFEMQAVVPALVQLRCKESYIRKVAGVRVDAEVSLYQEDAFVTKAYGEVQLTDYGVSGIPVFQISRFAAYATKKTFKLFVKLDFFADESYDSLLEWLLKRKETAKAKSIYTFCSQFLHQKLVSLILDLAEIDCEMTIKELRHEQWSAICKLCKELIFTVTGTNGFDAAQVCAGGLSMQEIDESMRLKEMPNMYVVGEVLDVDGMCGGYNLQWAWTSGYIAGRHAAGVDNTDK